MAELRDFDGTVYRHSLSGRMNCGHSLLMAELTDLDSTVGQGEPKNCTQSSDTVFQVTAVLLLKNTDGHQHYTVGTLWSLAGMMNDYMDTHIDKIMVLSSFWTIFSTFKWVLIACIGQSREVIIKNVGSLRPISYKELSAEEEQNLDIRWHIFLEPSNTHSQGRNMNWGECSAATSKGSAVQQHQREVQCSNIKALLTLSLLSSKSVFSQSFKKRLYEWCSENL